MLNIDNQHNVHYKYAYPIIKVYELACPISLEELKNKFRFVPPQAFSYAETFVELTEHLSKAEKKDYCKLWKLKLSCKRH